MNNITLNCTPLSKNTLANSTPNQAEDTALKSMAMYFKDQLFPFFNIKGEVDHIGPTETVHLEIKKFYQDFNFVMKDGSWIHFEFQSTDNKALDDLKRFRCYEAFNSYQYKVDVHTYVLFSGNIKHPLTEFTSGFNTYRVHPIIMKGYRAEEVFDNIKYKLDHSVPLSNEDFVPLTLCPLMGGDIPQKERIKEALRIIRQPEHHIPDADKLIAVIYAMASKFLDTQDLNEIKEAIKMTELGTLIYNDGVAQGISQGIEKGISQGIEKEALENAKNLFINGAPFDLVRKSIHSITDEALEKIYNEVMASKNE